MNVGSAAQAHLPPGASESSKINDGDYSNICSIDDFLTQMSFPTRRCREFNRDDLPFTHFSEQHMPQLRVFWYPTQVTEAERNDAKTTSPTQPRSIQEKINSVLVSLKFRSDKVLVQFWAPRMTERGNRILSVLEQPFGVGELYTGLCRYRLGCIQRGNWAEDISELGPVGRVFNHGSFERASNIEGYSLKEFPLRDYAIQNCGILNYFAFPIWEQRDHGGQQQQQKNCIGVLELLSCQAAPILPINWKLQDLGLPNANSHSSQCKENRRNVDDVLGLVGSHLSEVNMIDVLKRVRNALHLPLIQVWVPCTCEEFAKSASLITQLFRQFTSSDSTLEEESVAYFVRNGTSWVEKAYLLNKPCFSKDTRRFSISDYPLVPFTRSYGLTSCFAIPLQLIHPKLHPLILEAFLPPPQMLNWDTDNQQDFGTLLKSLLSTVAQVLSNKSGDFETTKYDEFVVQLELEPEPEPSGLQSGGDDSFLYFQVHQSGGNMCSRVESPGWLTLQSLESNATDDRNEYDNILIDNPDAQIRLDSFLTDQNPNTQATSEIRTIPYTPIPKEPFFSGNYNTQETAAEFFHRNPQITMNFIGGTQPENLGVFVAHETLGFGKEEQQLPMPLINDATARMKRPSLTDHPSMTMGDLAKTLGKKKDITLEEVIQQYGKTQKDAAAALGVHHSTLKRRCREFKIDGWGMQPRKETGHQTQAKDGHHNEREREDAGSMATSALGGKEEMIVKVTCGGDIAMFHFGRKSGRKKLLRELNERFTLKVGTFKIKYEYEGEWIIIACDKDLRFYINNLISAGENGMNLTVFPIPGLP